MSSARMITTLGFSAASTGQAAASTRQETALRNGNRRRTNRHLVC